MREQRPDVVGDQFQRLLDAHRLDPTQVFEVDLSFRHSGLRSEGHLGPHLIGSDLNAAVLDLELFGAAEGDLEPDGQII
jgi:hypothetical protein